jgi:hypothetical protein
LRQESPAILARRPFSRPSLAVLYAIVTLVVAAAAIRAVVAAHEDREWSATGAASWIWCSSGPTQERPVRFFATRDFVLPQTWGRATAKVFVDSAHVFFVNGVVAGRGAQSPGDPLALYRVERLLKPGVNRVAIEASSASGIGGILFSLDVDAYGRDAVVSDGGWRVDFSASAVASGGRYRPMVWGKPPQTPWGYPRMPRPGE